ncbi:TetR family transcriptional regulator [Arthrobacter sp. ERGS1:01]|uniref:TetR/AcrR family transcriptional regulator n=1 Tax=Arthrobacter sp. ERGS1:01 TaxID=1704044 RepID=UPI0006B500BD|nr:TetR family transcriptional regulator [Arthrobacter sp. ERGS1:01]ALE06133.1 TetR family transcriptional regulator [Arthrobacter sp. ERGS1:01]
MTPGEPATRRHEPDRRERLIDVTLDVIAEHGVAGTTHRKVAEAAGVPLGSMTYHFDGIDDLLAVAFTKLATMTADGFEQALAAADSKAEACEAVVALITGDLLGTRRNALLTYELYALAARRPGLRRVTDAWMARSRAALARHFDDNTTVMLDALIEGLSIHRVLAISPLSETTVREAVHRMVGTP